MSSVPPSSSSLPVKENPRLFAALQGEAFTFTAHTPQAVMAKAGAFADSTASWPETHPMALIAQPMNAKPQEEWGVSIVAKTPADLREKIAFLNANAKNGTWDAPPLNFRLKSVYTFKRKRHDAKIGFLFPGQGSQYVDMMRDLAAKYQVVQETFDEADRILEKMIGVSLTGTSGPSPARPKRSLRSARRHQADPDDPACHDDGRYGHVPPAHLFRHKAGHGHRAQPRRVRRRHRGRRVHAGERPRAVTSRAKEMSSVKLKIRANGLHRLALRQSGERTGK